MRIRLFLFLALALLGAPLARPWGATGHRAVGRIAENHLNAKAALAVRDLLGLETLAMASTWADEVRGSEEWSHTAPWHYVTIPDGETYETAAKNPDGDVVSAMREMEAVLRDPSASRQDKIHALRFLVHFVGDIHQPLHAGRPGDWGGNRVEVRWMGSAEPTNLHALWDSGLIEFDKLSYTELADWAGRMTDEQARGWSRSDYLDWVQESQELRAACYGYKEGERLGYSYFNRHLPTVHRRIVQAGIRLAALLNAVFDGRPLGESTP